MRLKKLSKVFSEQYEEYGSLPWNHIFVGDLWIKKKKKMQCVGARSGQLGGRGSCLTQYRSTLKVYFLLSEYC